MESKLCHRQMCVRDIAASLRFYSAVFGFAEIGSRMFCDGDGLEPAYERETDEARICRLANAQGIALQLTTFPNLLSPGSGSRRPMTARGMTHLNFYVRDFEETLNDVRRHGGQVIAHTLIETDAMSMIYCTDPDGIRVEIWTTRPYGVGSMAHAIAGIDRRFSHSGICVANLAASMAVYCALGFEAAEQYDYRHPPGQLDRMMEARDTACFAQMMRNGDDVVELLCFDKPIASGDGRPSEPDRIGLTGLAFEVSSVVAIAARLDSLGGHVLDEKRGNRRGQTRTLCADPDGVRIELFE